MKRTLFTLLTLLFSMATFALPAKMNNPQYVRAGKVTSLLSQPMAKQKLCAKKGYVGYQNSLSANYLTGIQGNKIDAVKAYGWSLVAYFQIVKSGNKKLIHGQQKTLVYVAKKLSMNRLQKKEAGVFADDIIENYSKSWPAFSTYSTAKDFPAPCNLK